ncbi:MotE family protein [Futiania mangrovi]|uniref:Magnesium transporter MgtE intracellular domain-containing protein n=1 Tax=Futiania mangrovi TaxID=2959716 RepID=A0A9J6PLB2_9PROT|nr:hypothetical protein [Futiania mangrovii]MCP1336834.1 hypothetical protein [Futiania mangrovii]
MSAAPPSPRRGRTGPGPLTVIAACLAVGVAAKTAGLVSMGIAFVPAAQAESGTAPVKAAEAPAAAPQAASASPSGTGHASAGATAPAALLAALQTRASDLDAREAALDRREAAVAAAEGRIEARLEDLRAAAAELEARLGAADDMARQDMAHLVGIYETMKPKEAAKIFDEMPEDIAAGFLRRLRVDAASFILANMGPKKAYAVTVLLAGNTADLQAGGGTPAANGSATQ